MISKRLAVGMVVISTVLCGWSLAGGVATGEPAPAFTLEDASGDSHSLSDYKGKYVVLEWVNYGCPFVGRHYDTQNMQNLQKKYADKGVVWLTICSSAPGKQGHMDAAGILAANTKNGHAATAYLRDESGDVARAYNAKTTPHMFIVNPDGTLGYQGAIDDNRRQLEGANNYVAAYLDLSMNGEPVKDTTTTSYGCGIKY